MSTKRYTEQMSLLLVLTLIFVLAIGTSSYAEEGQKTWNQGQMKETGLKQRSGSGTETMQYVPSVQRASTLLGMDVQNRRGEEKIGEIEDIVLTEKGDKVDYMVLSMNGEQTASRVVIPSDRLSLARDGQSVAIKDSVSCLDRKYSVGKDEWPEEVGGSSMIEKDAAEKRRMSDVIGLRVQGTNDENVGQIEDLLIDLENGKIKQAAVSSGGFLGFNEKLSTIEWTSVDVQNGVASVNMTQEGLEQSAIDSNEYWQQLGFEGEDGRNWKGFGMQPYRDEDDNNRRFTRSNRGWDYSNSRFNARSYRDEDYNNSRSDTRSNRDGGFSNNRSGMRSYRYQDDNNRDSGTRLYRPQTQTRN